MNVSAPEVSIDAPPVALDQYGMPLAFQTRAVYDAIAAGATATVAVPAMRVPWVVIALVALLLMRSK